MVSFLHLIQQWIPLWVVYWVGLINSFLVILFVLGAVIYFLLNLFLSRPPSVINLDKMPVLRPVPIPTRNRSFVMRIFVWIYDVRRWELAANWQYELSPGTTIILPKGFRFDGASIPRFLWAFLNPVGLLLIPGLIHDYGYRHRQLWVLTPDGKEAVPYMAGEKKTRWDWLFWRVGKQVNGTVVINLLAFLAVYLGGYTAW
ncbi:MAG: DUF1353 domain-containing protein [bacterium]|nr:DUF1353 domain-containing protein [bacterium]